MPPLIMFAAKFSAVEVVAVGLLFWLLLAALHARRNRRR